MPNDQFKVPEGALEAVVEHRRNKRQAECQCLCGRCLKGDLDDIEVALKQYNSELLGDAATDALAGKVWPIAGANEPTRATLRQGARIALQAAIDSVVKGGGDG